MLATMLYKQYLSGHCICTAVLFDTTHTVMLRCTDKDNDFELNRDRTQNTSQRVNLCGGVSIGIASIFSGSALFP